MNAHIQNKLVTPSPASAQTSLYDGALRARRLLDLKHYNDGNPVCWLFAKQHVSDAIRQFLRCHLSTKCAIDNLQLVRVVAYLDYYLDAPCWEQQRSLLAGSSIATGCKTAEAHEMLRKTSTFRDVRKVVEFLCDCGVEVL